MTHHRLLELDHSLLPQALALAEEVFPGDLGACERSLRGYVRDLAAPLGPPDPAVFWVAVSDRGVVDGIIGLYATADLPEDRWCGWFGVRAAQRRAGLGRMLLSTAISRAREQRARAFRLWTTPDATDAARLYDALGFDHVLERARDGTAVVVRSIALDDRQLLRWDELPNRPRNLGGVELMGPDAVAARPR